MTRPSPYPDNTYTPMADRPRRLECGSPMHKGHTSPPCCLVGWILHESHMESEQHIHVVAVPGHVEPIPVDFAEPDGPKEMVSDSGPLGGRPWSRGMDRRMSLQLRNGAWEADEVEHRPYPLDRAITGLRRYCSAKHSTWPDHRGQPVCWMLVRHITEGRYPVFQAAARMGLSPERASRLLHQDGRGAIDKLWTWVSNELNGIVRVRPAA